MLKRFILWDFPRGGWQYDVMVGIILAFVFLTPRAWFRDQARIPQASNIVMLPSDHRGSGLFWIDPQFLNGVPEGQRVSRATEIVRGRTANRRLNVTQVEPVYDSDKAVQGYVAFARP